MARYAVLVFDVDKRDWSYNPYGMAFKDFKTALLNYWGYRKRNPSDAVRLVNLKTGTILREKKTIYRFYRRR